MNPKQMKFFSALEKYTCYSGGVGSGKTFVGAFWAVTQMLKYPNVTGLITANTHSQLRKACLPQIFEILNLLEIPFKYKNNEGVLEVAGRIKVYCVSLDQYDNLRGIEAGWAWSDECAFYDVRAFDVLIGRIRDKAGPCQWKGTTTPNGFNWLYDKFVAEPLKSSQVVFGSSRDNLRNLDSAYIDALYSQYDAKLAEQEIEGKFVNTTSGAVYHAFDRRYNLVKTNDAEKIIILGLDFNVHPLCGAFCYQADGRILVAQELYLENSNTFQAAKEIAKRYPTWRVKVVPDETGNRRKSSATRTDHQIIKEAGFEIIPFKNPAVKDRQNNVNRLLHHQHLLIDSNNCPKLIKDLEALTHENKDDMLSHVSDALGYVAWHLDPMKKPEPRRQGGVHYI